MFVFIHLLILLTLNSYALFKLRHGSNAPCETFRIPLVQGLFEREGQPKNVIGRPALGDDLCWFVYCGLFRSSSHVETSSSTTVFK